MHCTNKPGCTCTVCASPSAKAEQDAQALEFMAQLEAKAARIRAQRIRATAQRTRRNEPIYHRTHGRLCDVCHFHKKPK
jgi:adenine C2-methylase RlmN of 23S rRNA A2503 and tRNA A37